MLLTRKPWIVLAIGGVVAAGCQSTGTDSAKVHHFDPVPGATVGAEELEPVEPRSIEAILADADAAFEKANQAQEDGDYEAALRNYNYMLELMIEADLDPAVFYNLRSEFTRILDTTTQQAPFYERGRIREWTEEDFRRLAAQADLALPNPLPERVLNEIDKIQNVYPRNFQRGLDRSFQYLPYIRAEFAKAGLPQDLVWLAMVESQFHPRATSRVGAGGMWQFMRGTGKRYGLRVDSEVDERYNWELATTAAVQYLSDLYEQFGIWPLAVSAYNRGEGGIERDIARAGGERNWWRVIEMPQSASHIPRETKEFYPKLLASIIVAKNPERYGFEIKPYKPTPINRVPVRGSYHLADLNGALGLEEGMLEGLNPDLVRKRTPSRGEFMLAVPAQVTGKVQVALKDLNEARDVQYASAPANGDSVVHVVRRGETLSEIAARYRTRVSTLSKTNNIRSAKHLKVGQRLTIPVSSNFTQLASASGGGGVYTVRRGDTLSEIATRHGVRVSDLQRWNNMGRSTRVNSGQKLRVSDSGAVQASIAGEAVIHTVQAGEYPAKIASAHGVDTKDLLKWNDLSAKSVIRVGQKLKVYPSGGTSVRLASADNGGTVSGGSTFSHTVAPGESPWVIAEKYGVKLSDLLAWNGLTKKSVLKVGDKLSIRRGVASAGEGESSGDGGEKILHVVSRGQSAWAIAKKYGVSMDDLFSWNGWNKAPVLQVGNRVTVYSN